MKRETESSLEITTRSTSVTPTRDPGRDVVSTVTPRLVVIKGDRLGEQIELAEETTIGRSVANGFVLDDQDTSRHHATVRRQGDRFQLEDLGSTNGTFVNGARILASHHLTHGDLIRIGRLILRFVADSDAEARYYEEIYRSSVTDSLTGAHNRRYLTEFLEREVARARRYGSSLSVIMFDIDHFKALNDRHGHLFGDHVLVAIVESTRTFLRKEQLIARYGGDEFLVVLPETVLAGASQLAEKLRRAAHHLVLSHDEQRVSVTLSLGATEWCSDLGASELIARVDETLYRAKKAGRDRVATTAVSTPLEVVREATLP